MAGGWIVAGLFVLALGGAGQAAREAEPFPPAPVRPDDAGPLRLAANKIFRLVNPFPFPIQVRILGDGPGFPQVMTLPAPPGAPVPVPYPDIQMKVQVKKPAGGWSRTFRLKWTSGAMALPYF